MSLNVLLRYIVTLFLAAFVNVIDGMIMLTFFFFFLNADIDAVFQAFCGFCLKMSSKLNTDFECPHPRLEFCHKSK